MTLNRDQLFADLDALTLEQIETGLAAGVWGDDARATVEQLRPEAEVRSRPA
jgi:hypothetical protein